MATTVVPLSLNETVRKAEDILLGTVTGKQSRWGNASQRWMETDYTFAIEEALHQNPNRKSFGKTVVLTWWGGALDGQGQTISDLRPPQVGERLLVMLRPGWREGGFTPVVGFNHGLFSVEPEVPGKLTLVRDDAGRPLALTSDGQVLRRRDNAAAVSKASEPDLAAFKQWLRSNITLIKSRPSDLRPPANVADPRVIKQFYSSLTPTGALMKNAALRSALPSQPPQQEATPTDIPAPPASSPPPRASSGEITTRRHEMTPKYSSSLRAHLPIKVSTFPFSWVPWSPQDQYQMGKWNWYASGIFQAFATPLESVWYYPDGIFELVGWPSSDLMQAFYGHRWEEGVLGVSIISYDAAGWILDTDIALNPAGNWTLDDELVYDGGDVRGFRQTMIHELGHMFGLDHEFNYLSLMNYAEPYYFRAFAMPYMDDARAIRALYPGNAVNRSALGIYLYYSAGSYQDNEGQTWGDWRDATYPSTVASEGTLTVNNFHLENIGTTTIDPVMLRWYLTTARNLTSPRYKLGSSVFINSLPPDSYFTPSTVHETFVVDSTVPCSSNYYLFAYSSFDKEVAYQESFPFANNYAFSRRKITVIARPPAGFSATDGLFDDKVRITWDAVPAAPFYKVYRATSPGGTKTAISSWQSSRTFDDTTTTPPVMHYYWVKAAADATGGFESSYSVSDTGWRAQRSITVPTLGKATPYPAGRSVSGVVGVISQMSVTLTNVSHTRPDDLDILLVGPGGQAVMLMSDAGGSTPITGTDLTFDDQAASALPDNGPIVSGTYRPTDYEPGETLPSPAASGPYGTDFSTLGGTDPNGIWRLFVYDDTSGEWGAINNGWGMDITVTNRQLQLALGAIASPQPRGTPFPVTVTARDEFGSVVGNYSGPVTLAGWAKTGVSLVEDFESGSWPIPSWFGEDLLSNVSADSAHDGAFGLRELPFWNYRTNLSIGNLGDSLSWWVKTDTTSGRAYLGFGASSSGCWSVVAGPNSSELIIQENLGYSYAYRASVAQTWQIGKWYRIEAQFVAPSVVIGKLYDSDGTTLLNSLSCSNVPGLPGGVAIRSINDMVADTITYGVGTPVAITPTNSGVFVNGSWTGAVSVLQAATNVCLVATDGSGHWGESASFEVQIWSPTITNQPQSIAVAPGEAATFSVTVGGVPPLAYQWWKDGAPITCTTSNLSLTAAQPTDAGAYFVVITNAYGAITSAVAHLVMTESLFILNEHFDDGVLDPAWAVSLAGLATGYSYTETNSELVMNNITCSGSSDFGTVWVRRSVPRAGDFSATCKFRWDEPHGGSDLHRIGIRLEDASGNQIALAQMDDGWSGASDGPQWVVATSAGTGYGGKNSLPYTGSATITIARTNGTVAVLWDGVLRGSAYFTNELAKVALQYAYQAAGNPYGGLAVDLVRIVRPPELLSLPAITNQPQSIAVAPGELVTLSVGASGGLLSYQWWKDGALVAQATNASLAFSSAQTTNQAAYAVVITNVCGAITSTVAHLVVADSSWVILNEHFDDGVLDSAWTVSFLDLATGWVYAETNSELVVSNITVSAMNNWAKVRLRRTIPPMGDFLATFKLRWAEPGGGNDLAGITTELYDASMTKVAHAGMLDGWTGDGNGPGRILYFSPNDHAAAKNEVPYTGSATVVISRTNGTGRILWDGAEVQTGSITNNIACVDLTFWFERTVVNTFGLEAVDLIRIVRPPELLSLPSITNQPQSTIAVAGGSVTFNVGASGNLMGYQWRKNGIPLTSATNATLAVTNVQRANAGSYDCVVINAVGFVISGAAVLKVEAMPVVDWQQTFGGTGKEFLYSLQKTLDGGILLGGTSESGISGNKTNASYGSSDCWIMKLDSAGNRLWDKVFGGSGGEYIEATTVKQTVDGGYIIGSFSSTPSWIYGVRDWVIWRVDANWNWLWGSTHGTIGEDCLFSIEQTADGGFLAGGYASSAGGGNKWSPGQGSLDYWVIKVGSDGDRQTDGTWGGTSEDYLSFAHELPDGGRLLVGSSRSGENGNKHCGNYGGTDIWLIRSDANYNRLWEAVYGGSGDEWCRGFQPTADGGFLFGCTSYSGVSGNKTTPNYGSSDFWIFKIDANGNKLWEKSYGGTGSDDVTWLESSTGGGFVVSGVSSSGVSSNKTTANFGGNDYWIIRLDENGNKVWEQDLGGSGDDRAYGIQQLSPTEYVVAGWSDSPISGNKTATLWGDWDYWVVKLAEPLGIITQPLSQSVLPGDTARFTVSAGGTVAAYQWRFNGANLSGATDSSYAITPVDYTNAGSYDVVLTSSVCAVTSTVAVLTVLDIVPPSIICPSDVTVGTDVGVSYATGVALGTPITGGDSGSLTATNNAPAQFPVGTNTVTWTAFAPSGNASTCVQRVIVRDTQPPILTCPTNLVVIAPAGQCEASVTFTVTATDNCDPSPVVICVPPLGTVLPVGRTNVLCTAVDASGNSSTCACVVTVYPATGTPAGETWTLRESDRNWTCVASSADGRKLVAGAAADQIYTSSDFGVSWVPRETSRIWYGVSSSADGTKLAAVANGGRIYTSSDSGETWTPRENNRGWWSVASSADGSKLAAVVEGAQIYTSSDFGVTWTAREGYRQWHAIASSSDGMKLVAGVFNGLLYTSTDAGVTWTPRAQTGHWNAAASSADGTKLLAVAAGDLLYTSGDSGANWSAHGSSQNWRGAASSADGSRLAAVGFVCPILLSADSGATWTTHGSSDNTWRAIASSADGSRLVAVANGGRIYTSAATAVPLANPPAILGATNRVVEATGPGGAIATFTVTATNTCQPNVPVVCTPPSGSLFPLGTNTVNCVAVDALDVTNTATFTVVVRAIAPLVTAPPQDRANTVGTTATFTVSAIGTAPLSYQWRFNGTPISGATGTHYSIASVAYSHAGSYTVVVTNNSGSVTSGVATLTVMPDGLVSQWPGFERGYALAVAVNNNLAYLAAGYGGLVIMDVSNPASPVWVGGYDTSGFAMDVAVAGNYAYVAGAYDGLQVIDVSNPASPVWVGGYDTSGYAMDVAVAGNYAYVADADAGLQVIDVSNPASPVWVGGYDTSGDARNVALSGNYAYVADGNAGLQVIDVSNPASPVRVGGYDTSGYALDVAVAGNYAYVADLGSGLQVIDVSNPASPVRVGLYDTSEGVFGVAVSGNYAYVATGDAGLQVINVSNPASPVRVGGYDTSGYARDVVVSGNYAYVLDDVGLQVIDVSNPASPGHVGSYPNAYALDVAVSGNYAYVADGNAGLKVIDVSNPESPVWVSSCGIEGRDANTVAVSGDYAYVLANSRDLMVISLIDPEHPSQVGNCHMDMNMAMDVAVSGNYAYVVGQEGSFHVIDVSNPDDPGPVTSCDTGGMYGGGVAVAGNYAYVADGDGLRVIDVSNPGNPVVIGNVASVGGFDVALAGNYAYVADADAGLLHVIDVSDPANPVATGSCETSEYAYNVAVSGNYAYVADYNAGLQVIDVSNPESPSWVGSYDTPGEAQGVAVSGNYAYVADGVWGLAVIRLFDPPIQPPQLVQQPQSQTAAAGSNVTLTVVAADTPGLGYQWFFNSVPIAGATSSSLTLPNFQSANQGNYHVLVTNAFGSETSALTALYLNWPLRFVECCANSNGLFHARLVGPAGTNIVIEDCTDWPSRALLATTNSPSGIIDFTNAMILPDPNSGCTSTNRFYRARLATIPDGMVLIPAGSFTMGDTLDGLGNAVPTSVTVSAFYMDVNLVSWSQWQSVYYWATNHGYGFVNAGLGKGANHPVQTVNWYDCVKWSNARSAQGGLTPVYYTDAGLTQVYTNGETDAVYVHWAASGYRLPTEAEWEKAARGGLSEKRFPWGDTISESQANYYSYWSGDVPKYFYDVNTYEGYNTNFNTGGEPYTSPVGSFAPNGYGLYDMAGNTLEWCWDWYETPYGETTTTNPTGPAGPLSARVMRGGDWIDFASHARCADRHADYPGYDGGIGFRCVRGF